MKFPPYPQRVKSSIPFVPEIPSHWQTRKLKYISSTAFSSVDKHSLEDEIPVKLCNYVDVYYNDSITPDIEFMQATATSSEISRFALQEGDVLVTKDSEEWNDIAIPAHVSTGLSGVVCGYHLAQVRPDVSKMYGKYLFRSFSARGINDQFRVEATGVTRYGLGKYALDNSLFPLPPLPEQKAIAAFLDRETQRIDALIAKKQKQLELLQRKRVSLISQAVTKGLDPKVKMKDTGVEWLGVVPEHWQVLAVKRISHVKRGASPRPIDDPKYFDENGEYSWVRIADVTASERYLETTTQKMSTLGQSLSVSMQPGDLFLSIAGTVGKPIITKIKCCIHDGFVYFPSLKENREYLYYIFSSGRPYVGLGKLGTQLNLNTDTVGSIFIPLPSPPEQSAIVAYLDLHLNNLASLQSKVNLSILSLFKYRSSLISAAVTGKIDVRKEVSIAD